MPIFQYQALNNTGAKTRGTIDADTPRDAREKLRRQEIRVLEMKQVQTGKSAKKDGAKLEFKLDRKVSVRELSNLSRQVAILLHSGVHLTEAMKVLIEQADGKRLEMMLRDLRERLVSGTAFADALGYHPDYFSDLYINMVRAGEASGNLDGVMERLATYLQSQAELRGKIVSALTYPAVMVFVGIAVVGFLMSYVVPKITGILIERGQALPASTQTLIFISDSISNYWWAMLLAVLGMAVSLRLFKASEKGRLFFDTYVLKIPVIGSLLKKQAISRFTVTFSTLLKSGLPALESLKIVSQVVNNAMLTKVIEKVAQRIIEGADIATPMKNSKIFPPMVGYMIAIGEQSGELENILDRISVTYDDEIDQAVQRMTSLIEPVIIVLLALVVGFIVMAVLLPLLQFNDV